MNGQNKQWTVKPPMAARLVAALSIVGLFVFAFFLGGRFSPWQRRLIALLIEIPGVISLIYVLILDWRKRRNLQESPARTIELSERHPRIAELVPVAIMIPLLFALASAFAWLESVSAWLRWPVAGVALFLGYFAITTIFAAV